MKTDLLISGPIFNNVGYGVVGREIVLSLYKTGLFEVFIDMFTTLQEYPGASQITDSDHEEISVFNSFRDFRGFDPKSGIYLRFGNPVTYSRIAKYNFGMGMGEASKIRKQSVDGCNLMDTIFTPTEFCVKSFKDSGVIKPVIITYLGASPKYFNLDECDEEQEIFLESLKIRRNFNFFCNTQWHPTANRKCTDLLIDTFLEVFKNCEDVGLILKVETGCSCRHSMILCQEGLNRVIAKYGDPGQHRVTIIFGNLSRKQMAALYKVSDCFVIPTLGEGFCLPLLESIFCGKPAVITEGSGPDYYIDRNLIRFIKGKKGKVPQSFWEYGFEPDFEFTYPNPDDFKQSLLDVYENYPSWKDKVLKQREKIKYLTWEYVTSKIVNYWQMNGFLN